MILRMSRRSLWKCTIDLWKLVMEVAINVQCKAVSAVKSIDHPVCYSVEGIYDG